MENETQTKVKTDYENEMHEDKLVKYLLSYKNSAFSLCSNGTPGKTEIGSGRCLDDYMSPQLLNPILMDFITLRSVVYWICELKNSCGNDSQLTASSFFEQFLSGVYSNSDDFERALKRWGKLCSGEIPTEKTLDEMFSVLKNEDSSAIIKHNLQTIINGIIFPQNTVNNILGQLEGRRRFFTQSEYVNLTKALNEGLMCGDYTEAILLMIKHGCENIDLCSSVINAQLFYYASCSEYQSDSWFVNIALAALLGDPKAAHECGRVLTQWKHLSSGMTDENKVRIGIALDLYKQHTNYLPILLEIVWLLWNRFIDCDNDLRQSLGINKKLKSITKWKNDYQLVERLKKYMLQEDRLSLDIGFFLIEKDFYKAAYMIVDTLYYYSDYWEKASIDSKSLELLIDKLLMSGVVHNETRCMLVMASRLAKKICAADINNDNDGIKYDIALFWELSKMSAFPYRDEDTDVAIVQYWQALVLEKTEPNKPKQTLELLKQAISRANSILEADHSTTPEYYKKLTALKNDAENRAKKILYESFIE